MRTDKGGVENQMLDAAMQARLRRVIVGQETVWGGQNAALKQRFFVASGLGILLAATTGLAVGFWHGQPLAVSDDTIAEALALATCQGQSPSSVFLEAKRETNSSTSSWLQRQEMVSFLIERAGRGDCGVAEGDGINREIARRDPSEPQIEILP